MKLQTLYPEHFGKWDGKQISLSPGINILYGENEAGKSTLFAFIQGMLFGIPKLRGRASAKDRYTKYLPWGSPGAYQGSLDLEIGGKQYHAERSFLQAQPYLRLYEKDTGRECKLTGELMENLLPELTEAGYLQTCMVSQCGVKQTDELSGLLQHKLANLQASRNTDVDAAAAVTKLMDRKKAILAAKTQEKLANVQKMIETDLLDTAELAELSEQRAEKKREEKSLREELAAASQKLPDRQEADLPIQLERFYRYQEDKAELGRRKTACEDKKRQLQALGETLQSDGSEALAMRRQLTAKRDRLELAWEQEKKNREEELRETEKAGHLPKGFFAGIAGILVLCTVLWLWKPAVAIGCLAGGGLMAAGYLLRYAAKRKELRKRSLQLQEAIAYPEELAEAERALLQLPKEEALLALQQTAAAERERKRMLTEAIAEQERENAYLQEELDRSAEELTAYFAGFDPDFVLEESAVYELRGKMLAQSIQQDGRLRQLQQALSELEKEIARLDGQLADEDAVYERLQDNRNQEAELQEKLKAEGIEQKAYDLALATMKKLSQEIHDGASDQLNARLSELAAELTGGSVQKLLADETLTLKADHGSRLVMAERLSHGTTEQLALALRLAVGETLYQESLPLLLDDSFVYCDDTRLAGILSYLAKCGRQVLLFTCQHREETILRQLEIPFHQILLSQIPDEKEQV